MVAMKKTSITAASAEQLIWAACEDMRSSLASQDWLNGVLDVLLWARWLPSSSEGIIGYFDAMSSLANATQWAGIQNAIRNRSGYSAPSSVAMSLIDAESIDKLRAALLPLARSINSSDPLQCKIVIEALLSIKAGISGRMGGELGCSLSMSRLFEAILASDCGKPVACLFPLGVSAAPLLGLNHPLLVSSANVDQEQWVLKLISLYPGEARQRSISDVQEWPLAIAGPPWGERNRELLLHDPWLPPAPIDCPSVIKDSEARRIYAAHQRCSGTTYALSSLGLGFRTTRDLEYFREEIIRRNWLDAVVALPAGVSIGTRVEGLLLVLKKDREPGKAIRMVDARELLETGKGKGGRSDWDPLSIAGLAQLLQSDDEEPASRLITAAELEANGFNLQPSRYLHSEEDLTLLRYLASRDTLQLGDLAEISRPVASLGRQEDDGVEVREVTPSDIDESGCIRQGSKVIRLPEIALTKGRQHLLEPGDVLLSIKGGLGKVAVVKDLEEPTVPGQAFCVVRLRPNAPLSPAALVQYLRSAVGQTLLNKAGQGAAVAFVPMGEVKGLPVVIPSSSELQRAESLEQESVALSREVEELSRRLQQLSRQGWMEDLPPMLVNSGEEVSS
jgi:type I restriction enzyme M protein